MLAALIILAGLGLIAGLGLGIASKVFAVEVDPRLEIVQELLPGVNCGGCGFPGCSGYAEALVAGRAVLGLCPVLASENADTISKILGIDVSKLEKKVAVLRCQGDYTRSVRKYEYFGVMTCKAAHFLGGDKGCIYGCLGYGDCQQACKFDSITILDGLNVIEKSICTGCGACVKACPRDLIDLVPVSKKVHVLCMSKDKGAAVTKICAVGCIGCKKCEKECPVDAIHVIENYAVIDYGKCINCGKCAEVCPTECIADEIGQRYFPEIMDECPGCMLCMKKCPVGAITGEKKQKHTVDLEKCVKCGICFDVCRKNTIRKLDPANVATHMIDKPMKEKTADETSGI